MKYYVVYDTNVLVSALLTSKINSATVVAVRKMFYGRIIPIYSREIINEYREVLNRKKFNFNKEVVDYFLNAIIEFGLSVEPRETGEILPDMKDLPFYEVVLEKKDEGAYLVTGNIKHFPKKPFIVTPREFLDIIEEE